MNHPASVRPVGWLLVSIMLTLLLAGCSGKKTEDPVASAREALAKNDSKTAIIHLKNALTADTTLAEARYLMGVALLRAGDAAGSEAELRKALGYQHPEAQVFPALAEALMAQRQYRNLTNEFAKVALPDRAAQARLQTLVAAAFTAQRETDKSRDAVQAALAADAGNGPALLLQARGQAATRDFEGALATARSVEGNASSKAESWKLQGDVLWYGKGQAEPALAAYRKSVDANPSYINGHVALLNALIVQGRFDDAAKQLEQLQKAAPKSLSAKHFETLLAFQRKDFKLAGSLSQQLLEMAPENAKSLQLAGEIALQANALGPAEAHLTKAVQLAPKATRARRMLVATYLRSGQSVKALAALQPALKADTVSAATNALAGEVYLHNGDPKKAEEYFSKAAKQDPKDSLTRTSLALTHLASGGDQAALGELQEIALSDKNTTADLALISEHLRRRAFDKALKAIDGLEKKQPDRPLAANLRGQALLAKKDLAGARQSFERAAVIDTSFFPAVASLALMDLAEKQPDKARKRFEALLAINPKNTQALLALAELRARSGGITVEVTELFARAIAASPGETLPRLLLINFHLRSQNLKSALAAAQDAVAALPSNPEMFDALGGVQQASGDIQQALAAFSKAASLQPESAQPLMRMANAQMAADNRDAAATSLRKALAIKPDLLDAQRGLMMLAARAKNYPEALRIARTVQKQRPKQGIGHQFEGEVAAAQKKWDQALEAYRLGLKLDPTPELATKTHYALGSAGKAADADAFASTWLRDHPKDLEFRLYLGDHASARADYVAAEKIYGGVVQIQPENAAAFNNLAWVNGKLGRDGAVAYAEKAIALDPNQPTYMDTLAMLLYDRGDYAKALEWQNKAVALQPQVGLYRLNLAKIQIKSGKKDMARKELENLAKLGDRLHEQAEVASLLKSL